MNSVLKNISKFPNLFRLALTGGEANILEGNLNHAIILLVIPMTLEMVMESLFAVVDIFFVSKLGVNAIAAVGLTESMMTIRYSLGFGLAMGTTAMVARRVGEKDIDGALVSAVQAIYLGITISLPIIFTGLFFAKDLLGLMGASSAIINEGAGYTKLIFASNLIIIILFFG